MFNWKRRSTRNQDKRDPHRRPRFENLDPRILLAADFGDGLALSTPLDANQPVYSLPASLDAPDSPSHSRFWDKKMTRLGPRKVGEPTSVTASHAQDQHQDAGDTCQVDRSNDPLFNGRPTRETREFRTSDGSLEKILYHDLPVPNIPVPNIPVPNILETDFLVRRDDFLATGNPADEKINEINLFDFRREGLRLEKISFYESNGSIFRRSFYDPDTQKIVLLVEFFEDYGLVNKLQKREPESGSNFQKNVYRYDPISEDNYLWKREFLDPQTGNQRYFEQYYMDGTIDKIRIPDPGFRAPPLTEEDLNPDPLYFYRYDPEILLGPHPDEPIKREEHLALFDLVPPRESTNTVEAGTVRLSEIQGQLQQGAKIWIRGGAELIVDMELRTKISWIRVEGKLSFQSDTDTLLRVVDLVVDPPGLLEIGTEANPIDANHQAQIIFLDRVDPFRKENDLDPDEGPTHRDKARDPIDVGGGLISHGQVTIHGAQIASYEFATHSLRRGTQNLVFSDRPVGWKAGDRLLFASTRTPIENEDEVHTIESISSDGRTVTLKQPLAYDHPVPAGYDVRVPIGNLSRNVILESEEKTILNRRAHVMFMHNHSARTTIDGALFYGLGRTDGRVLATSPTVDENCHVIEGTDANTIGRYAVHFHMRTGADKTRNEPHILQNSAIVDSPKLGFVNHGAYVNALNNVSYQIAGSHFFTENGSEIGTIEGNLAVRSSGSGLEVDQDLRFTVNINEGGISDHGYEGTGFWSHSSAVPLRNNYSFGHRHSAFIIYPLPYSEGSDLIQFAAKNLEDPSLAQGNALISITQPTLDFSNNVGATSEHGLFIRYLHRQIAGDPLDHGQFSQVSDSLFWSNKVDGVNTKYVRHIRFLRVTVLNTVPDFTGRGIRYGFKSIDRQDTLTWEDVTVKGSTNGIGYPENPGENQIIDSTLQNINNIVTVGGSQSTLVTQNNEEGRLTSPKLI